MRTSIGVGMLCVVGAAAALAGCGDSEETNTSETASSSSSSAGSGGQGGTSSSSSGAGGTGGQGGATGAGGGGGTGGGSNVLNGCDPAMAEDHTADTMVTINFGGALGAAYMPACVTVKAGTDVTFNGSFMFHPLVGGTVVGTVATPDPTSPITATATGMTATFTLANAGDYPYYCTAHAIMGAMKGAIFVVP